MGSKISVQPMLELGTDTQYQHFYIVICSVPSLFHTSHIACILTAPPPEHKFNQCGPTPWNAISTEGEIPPNPQNLISTKSHPPIKCLKKAGLLFWAEKKWLELFDALQYVISNPSGSNHPL